MMAAGGWNIGGIACAGALLAILLIAGIQTWRIERRDRKNIR